jgi:hypothetical protein
MYLCGFSTRVQRARLDKFPCRPTLEKFKATAVFGAQGAENNAVLLLIGSGSLALPRYLLKKDCCS